MAYMESQDKAMARTLGETGRPGYCGDPGGYHRKAVFQLPSGEEGKDILLTSKARQLLELVPEDLKSRS